MYKIYRSKLMVVQRTTNVTLILDSQIGQWSNGPLILLIITYIITYYLERSNRLRFNGPPLVHNLCCPGQL